MDNQRQSTDKAAVSIQEELKHYEDAILQVERNINYYQLRSNKPVPSAKMVKFNQSLQGVKTEEVMLKKLHDEIVELFNKAILKINQCKMPNLQAIAWQQYDDAYCRFESLCSSCDELNSVKNMMKQLHAMLEENPVAS